MAITTATAIALAAVGTALGAAGAIAGGITGYQEQKRQAEIAEQNARLQARQLEYNRKLEEREAARIEEETRENLRRQNRENELLRSRQLAQLGLSGAALASGSPLAVLGESAVLEAQQMKETARSGYMAQENALTKAGQYHVNSLIAKNNADNYRSGASGLNLAFNLAGTGIKAAGSLAQLGAQYNRLK